MADDENEGDPGSSSNKSQKSSKTYTEQESLIVPVNPPIQEQRELWNCGPPSSTHSGPRSLFLRRSKNGFGFTLRHFIVYPPESNAILARDRRRFGIDIQAIGDEPIDTIFVKNVRENSPASVAGLHTGDRLISVNEEDIAGLSYARVIQLIHKTGSCLNLLVVPKENDILQLYFSETAHNPETNQRPRYRSPEIMTSQSSSHCAVENCTVSVPAPTIAMRRHYSRCETTPIHLIGSNSLDRDRIASPTRTNTVRRSSEGSNERCRLESQPLTVHARNVVHRDLCSPPLAISDTSSCCSSDGYTGGGGSAAALAACRYSLDSGLKLGNYDSMSDSSAKDMHGSDDSLIMNRLRKSFEQKEEFMNRLPNPSALSKKMAKEFYGIPQKLRTPVWPPPPPTPSLPQPTTPNRVVDGNNASQESVAVVATNKTRGKQNFVSTLDKIQENGGAAVARTATSTSEEEEAEVEAEEGGGNATTPNFQIVSMRTKQFESGPPIEDKTELYRSELSRLSKKHNVTNVATRTRDYENRAKVERQIFATRETRSLEIANLSTYYTNMNPGNRIIPVGSKNLHCEPPADFSQLSTKNEELSDVELLSLQKAGRPVVRQDSYLAACRKPTINKETAACSPNKELEINRDNTQQQMLLPLIRVNDEDDYRPLRPCRLSLPIHENNIDKNCTAEVTRKHNSQENFSCVAESDRLLSTEKSSDTDDDKSTRRKSYLEATTKESMNVDSEYECCDSEPVVQQRRIPKKWRSPLFAGDIQRLRRFFEEIAATGCERGILGSRKIAEIILDQEQHNVIKEGPVLCKVTQVDGKKAGDRSWKPIWLVLKGPILCLYKERRESLPSNSETPATFEKADLGASCDRIDISCSVVEVACDYTKRKHVFRLNAPSVGAELLLQADDANSMSQWVKVLQEQTIAPINTNESLSNIGLNISPISGNKTLRKLASLRNRSPTGDSPCSKTRKSALNEPLQTSPKSRTWKNKIGKQFRRIQPGSSSPLAATVVTYPAGATIGIPLEVCPSSTFSEYVPFLVEICANIVEEKGLEIIGIYRVPGNTAAVTSLTEAVNRGIDITALEQDPRWSDVNVISSLLKSFFRKLPDALLTTELYPHFIKADRIDDPVLRMLTIRKLLHDLPDYNFETLRYLLFHLKKIVTNSSVNKMEARNLAIVFGPTLVRNGDDMVTMVTDMSHQCRIVESLLSHVDWCFGDGNLAYLKASIPDMNSVPELEATSANHCLLLGNIRKVESSMQSPVTAKDIVSTIIGAANRKMQKTSKHLSSSRKTSTLHTNNLHTNSSSEELLEESTNQNSSIKVKDATEKKYEEDEKRTQSARTNSESQNNEFADTVTIIKQISEDLNDKNKIADGNTWTYAGLSQTTQERIRRFEQETKAMLQREMTRQKRISSFVPEDLEKERITFENKNEFDIKQSEQIVQPVRVTDRSATDNITKNEQSVLSNSSSAVVCENPPPVVVMRRNIPNLNGHANRNANHMKRFKTEMEFNQNTLERSDSLDSLNHVNRPSSHVSDDGSDLLKSLTSTFDKKLKSLLTEEEEKKLSSDDDGKRTSMQKHVDVRCEIEDNSLFRDPSLHRTLEKNSAIDAQKLEMVTGSNKTDVETTSSSPISSNRGDKSNVVEETLKKPCTTCGCTPLKHTETGAQQNCENWKRTVLQETTTRSASAENRLQENAMVVMVAAAAAVARREPKLFYSQSVKLRRSASLKEDVASTKLRRSGSLNKHEQQPKITKFESWMLTKNAEAIKLKRSDSLTKTEKTATNMKRRQMELSKKSRNDGKESKQKRRNGTNKDSNIKRRHTVGGTKDFDKVTWLENQQRAEMDKENRKERRTSSPDLSTTKMTDFFIEVVVRPRSFVNADPNFVSRLLNIPLESHV